MTTEEQVDEAAAETARALDSLLHRFSDDPIFEEEARIVRRVAAKMQQRLYGGPKPKDPKPYFMLAARRALDGHTSRLDRPQGV